MSQGVSWPHEVWRKAFHLSTLALPVWIVWAPESWRLRGLLFAFFFFLAVDLLRLRWRPFRRLLHRRIAGSLRASESHRLVSSHYLTFAACLLAWRLPPAVAAAALVMPILGDAAAALVGRRFGRFRIGRKSVEGSAACFLVCALGGWFFLRGEPAAVVLAALVATVVEALPSLVDDNLSMPLASALVLWIMI